MQIIDELAMNFSDRISDLLLLAAREAKQFADKFEDIPGIYLEDGRVVFTIEGLYCASNTSESISLSEFQRLLYSSTLNAGLQGHGYQVVIYKSHGKVKDNWYAIDNVNDEF